MSTSVKDSNATHHEQYVGGGENEPKLPTRRGLQLDELGLRAIIGKIEWGSRGGDLSQDYTQE